MYAYFRMIHLPFLWKWIISRSLLAKLICRFHFFFWLELSWYLKLQLQIRNAMHNFKLARIIAHKIALTNHNWFVSLLADFPLSLQENGNSWSHFLQGIMLVIIQARSTKCKLLHFLSFERISSFVKWCGFKLVFL